MKGQKHKKIENKFTSQYSTKKIMHTQTHNLSFKKIESQSFSIIQYSIAPDHPIFSASQNSFVMFLLRSFAPKSMQAAKQCKIESIKFVTQSKKGGGGFIKNFI